VEALRDHAVSSPEKSVVVLETEHMSLAAILKKLTPRMRIQGGPGARTERRKNNLALFELLSRARACTGGQQGGLR
jgi:hypothetical protein